MGVFKIMKRIPKPSAKEIEKYLKKWNSSDNYVLPENALNKLFIYTFLILNIFILYYFR